MNRLMPWIVVLAVLSVVVVWAVLSTTADKCGEIPTIPPSCDEEAQRNWAENNPVLTAFAAGIGVLVVGSLVIIAVNSDRPR